MEALETRYMTLTLRNPLVASASPLNGDIAVLRALEDHGAAAVVLPSIFEEQIAAERHELESRTHPPAIGFAEAQSYFPSFDGYGFGTERYLETVRRAKESLAVPVIASLNGSTPEGWTGCAALLEQAGADAIELNLYLIAADPALTGRAVEQRHLDSLAAVKAAVSIPVAVKLGPYFSAPGEMARALSAAGADALVLFNRLYQPDIDIATLRYTPGVELSTPAEMRLALLWIALLHGRVSASLAGSTGVDSADDVLKYLLAGADVVMSTSALLRHGVAHMRALVDGLRALLAARGIERVGEVRGRMSHARLPAGEPLERASYIRMLQGYCSAVQ